MRIFTGFLIVSVAGVLATLLTPVVSQRQGQGQGPGLPISRSVRSPAVSYTNVLIRQRADPQILKHTDGRYYFVATVPEYDRVIIRQADTIQGLSSAAETTLWARSKSKAGVGYVWAPELHRINDKWYIYFALGRASAFDIRIFVLEGTGANPVTAAWAEKGFVATNWDSFSLDATTFLVNGTRYLCWAQAEPGREGTSLLLAPLATNPWTLRLPAVVISRPDLSWERIGHNVNEGAYAIERGGRVFLTYSASATDRNYAMGMLSANAGANLMNPASWNKSQTPVFQSNTATSQWGPGHSAFAVSEDGLSDILVYHARGYRDVVGEPLNNPDRHARVQKLYWKADGTPDFGIPVPDGKTPIRLRSLVDERLYVRHSGAGSRAVLQADPAVLAETQYRVVSPGLGASAAGGGGDGVVSLEATSLPGSFLRLNGVELTLTRNDNSTRFARESSFSQVNGLADSKGVSFEAVGAPGQFLRADGETRLVVAGVSGDLQERQATFFAE